MYKYVYSPLGQKREIKQKKEQSLYTYLRTVSLTNEWDRR